VTPRTCACATAASIATTAALGFNGRGLAIGTAMGDVLARRVLGEPAEAVPFPTTTASAAPLNLPAVVRYYARLALARLGRWSR
jgi:hypothetical protein